MASKNTESLSVRESPGGGEEEEEKRGGAGGEEEEEKRGGAGGEEEEEKRGGAGGEEEEEKRGGAGGERSPANQFAVKVLPAHNDAVTAARLCFDDRCVLSCSADRTAILWDVDSCRPLRVFDGVHGKTITECALIPNSNRMVTVSWDKTMVASDLETGQTVWRSRLAGLLTSCSSSCDGRLLVVAAEPQNAVDIVDASGGQILHHISDHHRSTITRCRFDPHSQRMASVSADRSVKLWDLRAQKTTISIDSKHGNVVSDCCFTNDGHFLCTASWDKCLKLWGLQAGCFRSQGGTTLQRGHEGSVSSCCFSNDATRLVSGSYDRTVALWDTSSLCQTLVLKGHSDWVTDVSVGAHRKLLASASKDCTVRLWNLENIEENPEFLERRRTEGGVHLLQCEECEKPFPVSKPLDSELLTRCVFCRLRCPSRYRPQPPSVM